MALALPLELAGAPAAAQPPPPPPLPSSSEYAVKIVCGGLVNGPLAPGRYSTLVNVHNPGSQAKFRWKLAVAGGNQGGPITGFVTVTLGADGATAFDCRQILTRLKASNIQAGGFIDGFLVIQGPPLDVVAVYTAASVNAGVASIHSERVPVRTAPMIWPPL